MTAVPLDIAPDHPAYAGHFPGKPILPAVVLLAEALAAVTRETSTKTADWTLQQAKFLQAVSPGAPLELACEPSSPAAVRFTIRSAGAVVATGAFARAARMAEPGTESHSSGRDPGPSPAWVRHRERGSMPLIRFMAWFSVAAGRPVSRVLLRGIAMYFFVFGAAARHAVQDFLARCHGRPPTLREQFRTIFAFAATIHDRVYFLQGRFDLFDIEVHGDDLFNAEGGALLMGAHLGSFEVMRACGRLLIHRQVAMAMYGAGAQKVTAVLEAIAPGSAQDIVALGEVGSMLTLTQKLEDGALVGVLADRTFGNEPTVPIPFMGAPAPLPTGPMRMAAALRQRVVFMTGLYRGGNRYELHFEPLADFTQLEGLTRSERDAKVRAAMEAYAARLEHHARSAPHNWFNFYPFWSR